MCVIKAYFVIGIWIFIPSTLTQRRIHNGQEVEEDHPYAVYFIKADVSERAYKGWTCGGSIVSPEYILTSAACVEDVKFMYAIAGYKKFVEYEKIDLNNCTKQVKKKIIFTCVPKPHQHFFRQRKLCLRELCRRLNTHVLIDEYEFEFHKIERWAYTDIALAKVETAFDFKDASYLEHQCSYIPAIIQINYEQRYQDPGVDAMALGWGHNSKWRTVYDMRSYNNEILNYVSTIILDKPKCKEKYKSLNETDESRDFLKIIDKYMICTLEGGVFNDKGDLLVTSKPNLEGCKDADDPEDIIEEVEENDTGIKVKPTLPPECYPKNPDEEEDEFSEILSNTSPAPTTPKEGGICQNDHGGPLVTWSGGHKVLIGVASVFRIVKGSCAGPYLFTSTQCNGKFLDCILRSSLSPETISTAFRRTCDALPEERGYDLIERRISWVDHPAGPAANEDQIVLETRPQVPISKYHSGG